MPKKVTPLDFLKSDTEYASEEMANVRFSICKDCPDLIPGIKVCKHCGCFMAAKTKLAEATCPIGKW
jgi:hypothetical protein